MDRRDVPGVAEWIGRERVTAWNGVPAQLHDLARQPGLDLSSLEEAWCGGAGCPDELRRSFEQAHPVPVRATYGLTEAPTVVAIDPVDGRTRPGASGLVLPHLDVAAYDEEGRRLPPGATGELRISPATRGQWAGAWTPAEVERVLRLHPAVTEAAVFGVPDERLGEKVAALVQLGAEIATSDLEELCRKQLAGYKVPETWSVVDSFPKNAMGKIIRTRLPGLLAQNPAPGRPRG
jgi:long-chain acyl-CoA synthetase